MLRPLPLILFIISLHRYIAFEVRHNLVASHQQLFANGRRENPTEGGKRLLIFGLGNVGTLVAKRSGLFTINDSNEPYFRCTFGAARGDKNIGGIQVVKFPSYELSRIIPTCTHILVTVPPIDIKSSTNSDNDTMIGGRPRKWTYFCDPVLNHPILSLSELVKPNTWVGYVSTTSVYGNHDGERVTEESELKCLPGSKGELYHQTELEWRNVSSTCGWRLHIFRCAGLYGDNRSSLHTLMKYGGRDRAAAVVNKVEFPTSRIHEEDVARAILHAMDHNSVSGNCCTWNLADDKPAPRSEVMEYASNLLNDTGINPVYMNIESTETIQQPSQRDSRRRLESKRVSNQLAKANILPDGKLMYPSYQEGLQAILDNNKSIWSQ